MTKTRNRYCRQKLFLGIRRWWIFSVLCGVMLAWEGKSRELTVEVTQGRIAPMPIAIPTFYTNTPALTQLASQISSIISADLNRCGLFQTVDPTSFIQTSESLQKGPRFADWRILNAQGLVSGRLSLTGDGRFRVEFYLYDVIRESQLEGLAFTANPSEYRRVAHKIADAIYQRITGDAGDFDTQIVYVSQTGPLNRRVKRLAIMDQDGANVRFLSSGQFLTLTPRFSPHGQHITYIDFRQRKVKVYLMNLRSAQTHLLGHFQAMTFAPRFSPDGQSVIMGLASGGRTSLYIMHLKTGAIARLTSGSQIDTSPCYSPDGSQIVFNSDRGGTPQLYVMDSSGATPERISFGKGRYLTPVWSPRGDWIAFTKISKGTFYIGVMKPDGSGERLLAEGYVVEDPCWSPNGRTILFTRVERSGKSRIYAIDLTGYHERLLMTPTDAANPSWSPLEHKDKRVVP